MGIRIVPIHRDAMITFDYSLNKYSLRPQVAGIVPGTSSCLAEIIADTPAITHNSFNFICGKYYEICRMP